MTSLHVLRAPVADFLTRVSLASPQSREPMALWPLVLREAATASAAPPYIALADALAKQTLRVDEIGDAGHVPHIRVSNAGDVAVLVLFGEELRGAKQNRIANASFLVGAYTDTVIDVSCVEAGRWSRERSAPFAASREVVSNSMRKKMAGQVSSSRLMGRGFAADQGQVWDDVSARLSHAGSRSRTSAYADYAEQASRSGRRVGGRVPADRRPGRLRVRDRRRDRRARGGGPPGGVRAHLPGAAARLRDRRRGPRVRRRRRPTDASAAAASRRPSRSCARSPRRPRAAAPRSASARTSASKATPSPAARSSRATWCT